MGPVAVSSLSGGMNSATWAVAGEEDPRRRWVAKLVRADQRPEFLRGLDAARRVQAVGIPTGVPEPTRGGAWSQDVAGGVLALLRWVDGEPLDGPGTHEQTLMGTTLGRAHHALRDTTAVTAGTSDPARSFPAWVDVDADHLAVEEWVRPAVRAALARYAGLVEGAGTGLTCGVLHGDPAQDAFLWSPVLRRCGLIDWSSALRGPLLYDLASATMYVGAPDAGDALVQAYARTGPLSAAEITLGLDVLLRVRWAVQADYFARRLATDDRTGISDPADNLKGLRDARDSLGRHG
nr:phosphotransferase [Kineococcus siccus]